MAGKELERQLAKAHKLNEALVRECAALRTLAREAADELTVASEHYDGDGKLILRLRKAANGG